MEHVLAAVAGCGIDDMEIELDAAEPPIMDGSAQPFVDALLSAGIVEQSGRGQVSHAAPAAAIADGESIYEAAPSPDLELNVTIDFPHPLIGAQHGCYRINRDAFARELAAARTFGFVHEVEALRSQGLIQGASLDNAVVLDETWSDRVASLRWPDEFVRHKALDCVGDLALAGARVRARITAVKPSHRGTVRLVRAMKEAIAKETKVIEIEEIMKVLPHRYPFLLVDRMLEIEDGSGSSA